MQYDDKITIDYKSKIGKKSQNHWVKVESIRQNNAYKKIIEAWLTLLAQLFATEILQVRLFVNRLRNGKKTFSNRFCTTWVGNCITRNTSTHSSSYNGLKVYLKRIKGSIICYMSESEMIHSEKQVKRALHRFIKVGENG